MTFDVFQFEAYYGMCKSVSVRAPFVIGTIPFKMEAAFAPPPPYMRECCLVELLYTIWLI